MTLEEFLFFPTSFEIRYDLAMWYLSSYIRLWTEGGGVHILLFEGLEQIWKSSCRRTSRNNIFNKYDLAFPCVGMVKIWSHLSSKQVKIGKGSGIELGLCVKEGYRDSWLPHDSLMTPSGFITPSWPTTPLPRRKSAEPILPCAAGSLYRSKLWVQ